MRNDAALHCGTQYLQEKSSVFKNAACLFRSFLCIWFNNADSTWVSNAECEVKINCNFRRIRKRVVMVQLNRQYWHLSAELRKPTQNPHKAVQDRPRGKSCRSHHVTFSASLLHAILCKETEASNSQIKGQLHHTQAQRGSRGIAMLFL